MPCRHHDVQVFDGLRCCLACGEAIFDTKQERKPDLPRSQNAPYTYAHLNYSLGQEIRLCVLFSGRPTDDLDVDLVHVNIRNHPPYEAISYAWATQEGDDSLSQTVHCHGGTIPVTKTCEAALKRLRLWGRSRYLWVDALCIDQNNVKERNHQVGFMGTIFSNASQVLIYLGPGSPATDRMLNYLKGDESDSDKRIVIHSVLDDFLDHRWFDRVWILQEIALARLATMVAGEKTIRWTSETINKLLALCTPRLPPSALRWLPASQPERDVLTVLHRSRNCSSTDPRDKVYAVLGLAQAEFRDGFPIDYSLTVEEVYTQLATHTMELEQELRVLKYADGLRMRDMPSWVPQWDYKIGYDPLPKQFTDNELVLLASVWYTPALQSLQTEPDSSKELLQKFLEIFPKDQQPLPTAAWLEAWIYWTKSESEQHATLDPEAAALYITKMHALDFHFSISPREFREHSSSKIVYVPDSNLSSSPLWRCLRVRAHRLDFIKLIKGYRSARQLHHFTTDLPKPFRRFQSCDLCLQHYVSVPICQAEPTIPNTITDEFIRDMKKVLGDGKTMFQTLRSVGVGRVDMHPGDSIWALDGVDVPFILRKVDDHYIFIGECFLYRALRSSLCMCCGCELEPWPIVTHIIDIW
ncbi:hypothetical protein SLS60_002595 [Paraconiothyrium brasiliense]|uniref:Heterokaryon incompatibility domain-containing protein n=1 Tax=Paraconiothyrium brasiliense TaxID=300254 RepID=A0ABR3RT94_9PLEO